MAKKKQKFYVVWEGVEPGVYDNWAACQAQIKGYPGAKYKSFKTKELAEEAYGETALDHISERTSKGPKVNNDYLQYMDEIESHSICVDAACSGNPGKMEYRGVTTSDKTELFLKGPYLYGTNNIGEFLALVHGLALLKNNEDDRMIYSDSRIAIGWVAKGKCKTQLVKNSKTKALHALIRRAEVWLKENEFETKILKWDTKRWGEIPADFGRK